jgi:uncharacterized DUF497 family protein
MEFEWDERKNEINFAKHGLDFNYALQVFADPWAVTISDDRFDYGEARKITIGQVDEETLLMTVHTDRRGVIRIISARRANKKERRILLWLSLEPRWRKRENGLRRQWRREQKACATRILIIPISRNSPKRCLLTLFTVSFGKINRRHSPRLIKTLVQ